MRLREILLNINNDQEVLIDFQEDEVIICGKCKAVCGKIRDIEKYAVMDIKTGSLNDTEYIQICTDELSDLELACKGEADEVTHEEETD